MWSPSFLIFKVLIPLKMSDPLLMPISNLRSFPKYWQIGMLWWLLESFLLGLMAITRGE